MNSTLLNKAFFIVFFVASIIGVPSIVFAAEGHLDWSNFAYRIFNLVLFIGIIYFFVGKKIHSFFKERKRAIIEDYEALTKEKKDVEAKLSFIRASMDTINTEREKILADAQIEAHALRESIIADAQKEAKKIVEYAQKKITIEREKIKGEIITELAELIYQDVERELQSKLTPSMHKQIFENSIKKVVTFEKEISSKTVC